MKCEVSGANFLLIQEDRRHVPSNHVAFEGQGAKIMVSENRLSLTASAGEWRESSSAGSVQYWIGDHKLPNWHQVQMIFPLETRCSHFRGCFVSGIWGSLMVVWNPNNPNHQLTIGRSIISHQGPNHSGQPETNLQVPIISHCMVVATSQ